MKSPRSHSKSQAGAGGGKWRKGMPLEPVSGGACGVGHAHGHDHSHCQHTHVAEMPELAARLRKQSRRVTGPRQAILEVMRCNPRPMTIKEIHSQLKDRGCDLATVYRSMSMLQEMGMVCRVSFDDASARFELLREGDDGHHHHLVCTQCDRVLEIEECVVEDIQKKLAVRSGFKGVTHRLEFFGVCPQCQ